MSVAVFELASALMPELLELVVGPWKPAAPSIAAFDAGGDPLESQWRVDLARDDAASWAELARGERSVAETHAVLDDMPRRFDQAIHRALAELPALAGSTPTSRAAVARRAQTPAPSPIEAALIAALTHAEPYQPPPGDPAPRPTGSPGRLEQALARVADLARGRARIATRVDSVLVAHSLMALSGDTELWASPRLSLDGARLHARSVAVALGTRHAWARILTLVTAGCGRLVTLGLPAAGVATLPLVWRFLRDLLREIRDPLAPPVT